MVRIGGIVRVKIVVAIGSHEGLLGGYVRGSVGSKNERGMLGFAAQKIPRIEALVARTVVVTSGGQLSLQPVQG